MFEKMFRRWQFLAGPTCAVVALMLSVNPAAAGDIGISSLSPNPVGAGSLLTVSGSCSGIYDNVELELTVALAGGGTKIVPGTAVVTTGLFSVGFSVPATATTQTASVSGVCSYLQVEIRTPIPQRTVGITAATPPSTTTTTIAPTTTTIAPTTTTIAPTTTAAATTTTLAAATLPATGGNSYSGQAAAIGALVLGLGFGLSVLARRRNAAGS